MLHNSNRFPDTTKWRGSWGMPARQYGQIVCETCHTKNALNIKRIRCSINAPNSPDSSFPGQTECNNTYCHSDGTIVATGATMSNLTPEWGSTGICDSCHAGTATGPSYGNGLPKANSHAIHVTNKGITCDKCHVNTTADGTTITDTTNHVNRAYNVDAGAGVTFSYAFATTGGSGL